MWVEAGRPGKAGKSRAREAGKARRVSRFHARGRVRVRVRVSQSRADLAGGRAGGRGGILICASDSDRPPAIGSVRGRQNNEVPGVGTQPTQPEATKGRQTQGHRATGTPSPAARSNTPTSVCPRTGPSRPTRGVPTWRASHIGTSSEPSAPTSEAGFSLAGPVAHAGRLAQPPGPGSNGKTTRRGPAADPATGTLQSRARVGWVDTGIPAGYVQLPASSFPRFHPAGPRPATCHPGTLRPGRPLLLQL